MALLSRCCTGLVFWHPEQTLEFFEVGPRSKLAEICPSGGWCTGSAKAFI